jgi:uncharacterized protein (DUF2141 family)
MKRVLLGISVFILFLSVAHTDTNAESNAELTVIINGIEEMSGQISIGLYTDRNDWPDDEKAFTGIFLPISGDTISYTFKDLPQGIYAVALYHDANMNEKLDKGLFRIPKEGYAFSNNVFGVFGPPKMEDASFLLESKKEIAIEIKY